MRVCALKCTSLLLDNILLAIPTPSSHADCCLLCCCLDHKHLGAAPTAWLYCRHAPAFQQQPWHCTHVTWKPAAVTTAAVSGPPRPPPKSNLNTCRRNHCAHHSRLPGPRNGRSAGRAGHCCALSPAGGSSAGAGGSGGWCCRPRATLFLQRPAGQLTDACLYISVNECLQPF